MENESKKKGKNRIITFLVLILILTGCASTEPVDWQGSVNWNQSVNVFTPQEETEEVGWGLEADFSYEIPTVEPGVLVSRRGYESNRTKMAVIRGDEIPLIFVVKDMETGEHVYTGATKKKGEVSYADFSSVTAEGTYRIVCGFLGESYDFSIGTELYEELLTQTEESLNVSATATGWQFSEQKISLQTNCRMMAKLLSAYEMYGNLLFEEEEKARFLELLYKEAQWLITRQDKWGLAVEELADVTTAEENKEPTEEELKQSAYLAAVMAKFGYNYKSVDNAFATSCLNAANRGWKYVEKYKKELLLPEHFFASAELFRATGNVGYHNIIKNYSKLDISTLGMSGEASLYGEVTYLSTKGRVEKKLCAQMMKDITSVAEKISREAKGASYLTVGTGVPEDNEQLLWNMEILGYINGIITNHEYTTVMENHLQYFMGRNQSSTDYTEAIMAEPIGLTSFYNLVGGILSYK